MESLLEILELETGKLTTANRTWAVDKKKCTFSPRAPLLLLENWIAVNKAALGHVFRRLIGLTALTFILKLFHPVESNTALTGWKKHSPLTKHEAGNVAFRSPYWSYYRLPKPFPLYWKSDIPRFCSETETWHPYYPVKASTTWLTFCLDLLWELLLSHISDSLISVIYWMLDIENMFLDIENMFYN